MYTIWQSLTDYQRLLLAVPLARHTHRGVLRRRHAATHQPGARREVSHLRPDPATAAEGRGHCCISMATNLCLHCRPMSPLRWKMDAVVTGFHPRVLICGLQNYMQYIFVIRLLIRFSSKWNNSNSFVSFYISENATSRVLRHPRCLISFSELNYWQKFSLFLTDTRASRNFSRTVYSCCTVSTHRSPWEADSRSASL